jgi:hypothetical protein
MADEQDKAPKPEDGQQREIGHTPGEAEGEEETVDEALQNAERSN